MKKSLKIFKNYIVKGESNGEKCLNLFCDFKGQALVVKWTGLE